ncbi:MAG: tryptophan synthase subunit beta [Alphaproteobacteria bacterium]|nr:tryptophan synthase subunit beta [Alphaproteobacteria bacterium]MCB9794399.1 tryptophan synthase subunit beta [Alphaproteobacteria bacterium]
MTAVPDARGHFGQHGGRYVAETLIPPLEALTVAWETAWADPGFRAEFEGRLRDYVGRPSLLYKAERLSAELGARIWLKREDLNHTGAHKINNCIGQVMLAVRMGKRRIIAETGAGQHGVATATAAALFGLPCVVYMGAEDTVRQRLNVARMELLGAEVKPVHVGTSTLKDAMNEALRDWVTNVEDTFYCIGSVAGPHPYPVMVRELQACIGIEAKAQLVEAGVGLPDAVVACVGGGSNAMGIFHAFRDDLSVRLIGVEAAGRGLGGHEHAASIHGGRVGVLHGQKSYLLQDANGQVQPAHSISAGLDYPGVGPEHAWLHDTGRATYLAVDDEDALLATRQLSRIEGIIPALESAHALAALPRVISMLGPDTDILVNLSGRGDKDMETLQRELPR